MSSFQAEHEDGVLYVFLNGSDRPLFEEPCDFPMANTVLYAHGFDPYLVEWNKRDGAQHSIVQPLA